MNYTTLARTGLRVSTLGLGCARPSRLGLDTGGTVESATRLVHCALDGGINIVDTAPAYGTEELIGAALVGRPDIFISTKTLRGLAIRAGWRTLVARTRKSLDTSLRLLRRDHIDIYHVHHLTPGVYGNAMDAVWEILAQAKQAGKVRFLGVTEAEDPAHRMLWGALVDERQWDVFMGEIRQIGPAFTSIEEAAIGKGIGVIAMRANTERREREGYAATRWNPRVHVTLCGTGNEEHLKQNMEMFS